MLQVSLLVRTTGPGWALAFLFLVVGSRAGLKGPVVGIHQAPVGRRVEAPLGFCSKATPENHLPQDETVTTAPGHGTWSGGAPTAACHGHC